MGLRAVALPPILSESDMIKRHVVANRMLQTLATRAKGAKTEVTLKPRPCDPLAVDPCVPLVFPWSAFDSLTSAPDDSSPTWAPDGSVIVTKKNKKNTAPAPSKLSGRKREVAQCHRKSSEACKPKHEEIGHLQLLAKNNEWRSETTSSETGLGILPTLP